jgi:hypothetical protein
LSTISRGRGPFWAETQRDPKQRVKPKAGFALWIAGNFVAVPATGAGTICANPLCTRAGVVHNLTGGTPRLPNLGETTSLQADGAGPAPPIFPSQFTHSDTYSPGREYWPSAAPVRALRCAPRFVARGLCDSSSSQKPSVLDDVVHGHVHCGSNEPTGASKQPWAEHAARLNDGG